MGYKDREAMQGARVEGEGESERWKKMADVEEK